LETHAARGFSSSGDQASSSGRSQRKGTGKEKAGVALESELSNLERGGEDRVN
jgi:hypothetical protein